MPRIADMKSPARHIVHRRSPVGAPPGTLIPDEKASPTTIRLISIADDSVEEETGVDLKRVAEAVKSGRRVWIDVVGLADLLLVSQLGDLFGLNSLALEDITNTSQRPKVDVFDEHPLIVVHMFDGKSVSSKEQVSIVFGESYVLTFQERPGDCLDPVRKRLSMAAGRIRSRGSGYLVYAILDTILDAYFPLLEQIGEELEDIEDRVTRDPVVGDVSRLHELRRELLVIKRALWPTRELLSTLAREELALIPGNVVQYLRDTYDHAVQLIDIVETYRELTTGLHDLYLSSLSTRMNEVMKVLTIVATIFIPLTFLAGVWGMNFNPESSPWNMPELNWYFGYPAALIMMVLIGVFLVAYFRWKRWL
jgi:magnesium transporter